MNSKEGERYTYDEASCSHTSIIYDPQQTSYLDQSMTPIASPAKRE